MSHKLTLLFDEDLHKQFYLKNVKPIEDKVHDILREKPITKKLTDTDKKDLVELADRLEYLIYEIKSLLSDTK